MGVITAGIELFCYSYALKSRNGTVLFEYHVWKGVRGVRQCEMATYSKHPVQTVNDWESNGYVF